MQSSSPRSTGTATAAPQAPAVVLDALELWVGDLDRTRRLLESAFGFEAVRLALPLPPGAGAREERAAWLSSGGVRLVLRQGPSVAGLVARHGDTVADVALTCADPDALARRAADAGLDVDRAGGVPRIDVTGDGTIRHSLRSEPLVAAAARAGARPEMLAVDHVTYCLEHGTADRVAEVYATVFGLEPADLGDFERVGDDATGMRSVVLRSAGLTVVLIEPLSAGGSGQIQRFMDAHAGPGVQHAAIAYDDLCAAVEALRGRGVRFLPAPGRYYERSRERLAGRRLEWDALRRLEILVDADDDGLLYQLFTRPITERGTFFVELIQRSGASGFGGNNVRALYSAVAAAQARNGAS